MNEVGWLIILLPGVGCYIMGYESDPLTSYPKLSNFSYSVKLIKPLTRLFLHFIYRVLIPPLHQPDRPWHPLHVRAQCTDGATGYPLQYGCLPLLDVNPNGVDLHGFHCLLYRWVLPLPTWPAFRHHHCDSSRLLMVECRQDLEHLPVNHLALAAI